MLASLDMGPGDDPWYAFVDLFLLIVTPPAVAFVLAYLALRADRSQGKAVFLASTMLLAYSVWLSLMNITSIGSLIVVVLALILWYRLTRKTARGSEVAEHQPAAAGEATTPDATRSPGVATAGFALGVMACMTVLPVGIVFTPPVAIPALVLAGIGAWLAHRRRAPADLAVSGMGYAIAALVAVAGRTVTTGWA